MSTVTTTRPIDEGQLNAELGDVGVTSRRIGEQVTVSADVPKATLQAAIDAHVPAEPPPTTEALLQQQIDELTDLILGGM
ncbi:hypothetical protein [Nocardioides kribbensis]|uniref:Uncharacterized protein n=1 Tax=Nocardioides kribbensis TaxID=305517 RepID=A0ABV1NYV7_9ACTN